MKLGASGRIHLHIVSADEVLLAKHRPKKRADCVDGPRPCIWVGCRYNNYLNVNSRTGQISVAKNVEPEDVDPEWSCALDVAARGEHTLEEIGDRFGTVREGIRQTEVRALRHARRDIRIHGTAERPDRETTHDFAPPSFEYPEAQERSSRSTHVRDGHDVRDENERVRAGAWKLDANGEFPAESDGFASDRVWESYCRAVDNHESGGEDEK